MTEKKNSSLKFVMINGTMLEDPFDYEKIKSLMDEAVKGKDK